MKKLFHSLFRLCILTALVITALGSPAVVKAAGNTWAVNPNLADDLNCTSALRQCKTIQKAVDTAEAGDIISLAPGTFVENVVIGKSVTIDGAGIDHSIVMPAVSSPACAAGEAGSLCTGASHVFLVQASGVTIQHLTVDGDNPALTSGKVFGGADMDARTGIATATTFGTLTDLKIYGVKVQNIYMRGINTVTSGGTFDIRYNTVKNVNGDAQPIAIMNGHGSGTIAFNTIQDVTDGIASNYSRGTRYISNTVINASTGLHTDNAGSEAVSTADEILNNTVSDCKTNGYGLFAFVPYIAPVIRGNTVSNCAVGIALASGPSGGTGVYVLENNVFDGKNLANSTGVYITDSSWYYHSANINATLTGNKIINNAYGILTEQLTGFTLNLAAHSNDLSGNTLTIENSVGTTDNPSNTGAAIDASLNWWGSAAGPAAGAVTGTATTSPYATVLISAITGSVHEVGETGTLDTNITGSGIFGLQLVVNHDPAVLTFASGVKHNVASWYWDQMGADFITTAGKTTLAGSIQAPHTAATLAGESVATWTYTCTAPGTSLLTYDTTSGTGTNVSDKDSFGIPAAFTGGAITCVEKTASVEGTIELQGRRNTSAAPAGWNDAVVILTCANVTECGTHQYQATTDATGHYTITKTTAGTGVILGTYTIAAQRRAYLGAVNGDPITVAAGSNIYSPAPKLLGGDIIANSIVDVYDLSSVGTGFLNTITADTGQDINGDGIINIFDLVLVGSNFGKTSSTW